MLKRFAAALLLALMLPACALAESALLGVQVKDTAAPAAEPALEPVSDAAAEPTQEDLFAPITQQEREAAGLGERILWRGM